MKTKIHVNRHNISRNKKDGGNRPVFTVKNYIENRTTNHVEIKGPAKFIYSPDKPLSCGAVAWVETTGEVIVS